VSPRRLTRQESQARTRERLLNTAERVFLKKGYHEASIGEIAEAAGYTTGAVYSNFANKEELGLAVLERRVVEVGIALQEALSTAEPTFDARLHAAETLWGSTLGSEEWMVLATEFTLAARHKPALRKQFFERVNAGRVLLGSLLAHQYEEIGIELPTSPDRLAATVLGLSIGLSVLHIADPELGPAAFGEALALLLRGLELPVPR